jgi:putative PIN family toxin of toxin-antitoxin system
MGPKVVIDTNIVVSAAISEDGNPAKIFEMLLREEIVNYTTDHIIAEIRKVMSRPKIAQRLSMVEANFIIDNFERFSKKIKTDKTIEMVKDDPADNKFIECAAAASADYIISGDEHLLKIKEFRKTRIISPAEFIKISENKQTKQESAWDAN